MYNAPESAITDSRTTPVGNALNALSDTIGQLGTAAEALQNLLGPVLSAVQPTPATGQGTPAPLPICTLTGTLDAATARINAVLAQLLELANRTCL